MEQRKIAQGDYQLNVAVGKENGPPLLFLHGVTLCWQDFSNIIDHYKNDWQVIALDFRGHGQSDHCPDQYCVLDYVKDAVAVCEQLTPLPCVLFGHSLGALVASVVAAHYPDRIRAVVLEDLPIGTVGEQIHDTVFYSYFSGLRSIVQSRQSLDERIASLTDLEISSPNTRFTLKLGAIHNEHWIQYTARCLETMDPKLLDPLIAGQWLQGFDKRTILPAIEAQTLLLQGNTIAGGMLPPQEAIEIEQSIANCQRVPIQGAGHLIHWQHPEKTCSIVDPFLDRIRRS